MKIFSLYIILLSIVASIFGQNQEYDYSHFNKEEGLSGRSVYSCMEDYQGYIWVGTDNGINKFTSKKFISYDIEGKIWGIFEDSKNNIWVANSFGLYFYNRKLDVFKNVSSYQNSADSLPNKLVFSIFEDNKGYLWIGHFNGFSKIKSAVKDIIISEDGFPKAPITYINILNKPDNFTNINAIAQEINGRMWFGSKYRGIYIVENDSLVFEDEKTLPRTLLSDGNTILIGDWEKGFGQAQYANNEITYSTILLDKIEIPKEGLRINDIKQISDSSFWIGTEEGLLQLKKTNTNTTFSIQNHLLDKQLCRTIALDNEGGIWCGSFQNGLHYFAIDYQPFKNIYLNSFLIDEKENDQYVYSLTQNYAGEKFASIRKKGTYIIKDDKLIQTKDYIEGVTLGNANYYFDETIGIVKREKGTSALVKKINQEILDNVLLDVLYDQFHNTIFISYNMVGVLTFNCLTKEYKEFRDRPLLAVSMNQDAIQQVWIRGKNKTFIYNPITEKIENYHSLSNYITPHFSGDVLYSKKDSNLWIPTNIGLAKYSIKKDTLIYLTTKNNLPDNTVYSVLDDLDGNLWIGTDYGLSKLDYNTGKINNYYTSSGFLSNIFTEACMRDEKGIMYFGTQIGIVAFNPREIKQNNNIQKVVFTDFRLFNQSVKPGLNSILDRQISETTLIELNHKQNVITFEFEMLNYYHSENNQFAFKMEGIDEKMNYVGSLNKANYTSLPPGEYTFKVIAANSNELWNREGCSIKIIIHPPWWKIWWVKLIFAFIIIMLTYLAYQWRVKLLKERQILLEKEVKERTIEIVKQKEEIEAQSENLMEINFLLREQQEEIQVQAEELFEANQELQKLNSTKDKFFSIIAHDLKNPFQAITGFSQILKRDFDKLNSPKKIEFIGIIENASKTASSLLENLLTWSRAQTNRIKFTPSMFDISTVVSETFNLLDVNAKNKDIQLLNKFDPPVMVYADSNMITTVIRNIISNALKFTPAGGTVYVDCQVQNSYTDIKIKDTGVGMDSKISNKLFAINSNVTTKGTSGEEGTGLGLIICKEFVDKNNGEIKVESKKGKGSTFIIRLPNSENSTISSFEIPLEQVEENLPEEITPKTPSPVSLKSNKPTVLIVEDSIEIRMNIKLALEKDFLIIEASNGQEGLQYAQEILPDLIISDIMMPKMNGVELCSNLKINENTSHIPIVLLTAKSKKEDKLQGYQSGADLYITKPFDNDLLLEQTKSLLTNRKKMKENFIRDLVLDTSKLNLNDTDKTFIDKAIAKIEEQIENPEFDLGHFADAMNCSKSLLHSKLRALVNQTPTEFIRNIRLKKAAKLIAEEGKTVNEVFPLVGFTNRSYFSKSFNLLFGMYPNEYRKKHE